MKWIKSLFAKKIIIQEASIESAGFKLVEVDPDKHYILFISPGVNIDDLCSGVLDSYKVKVVRVH